MQQPEALPIQPLAKQPLINSTWPFAQQLAGCFFASLDFYNLSLDDHAVLANQDLEQISNPKRRQEFIAGRLCAQHALRQFMPLANPPSRLPDSRLPAWPNGSCGSISHSHGRAVAVAASEQQWLGLGIDIERLITQQRAEKLRNYLLTDAETQLPAPLGWQQHELLTCIFSAKESLFKLLNPLTNCYFGFQDAQVCCLQENGSLTLRLLKRLSNQWPEHSLIHGQWHRSGNSFITITALPVS